MARLLPLVLLVVLTSGCAGSALAGQGAGFVAGDGTVGFVPVEEREPAPAVVGETVDGESLALADLEGPVVVNFWASWCGPCAKEAPALQNVADAYDGRVEFVGVNVKDDVVRARNFEDDFKVEYPSWFDASASIAASFGGIGPAALPSTIVLDAEHRVAARLFGAVNEAQLADQLDRMLDPSEAPE
jgi:thiol-disulfide isomerase/thioredoxin